MHTKEETENEEDADGGCKQEEEEWMKKIAAELRESRGKHRRTMFGQTDYFKSDTSGGVVIKNEKKWLRH